MSKVRIESIDEIGLRRGQDGVTVAHDLDAKRLLFFPPARAYTTVQECAVDLSAHGGEPIAIAHACMDMSAAYRKGVTAYLPKALISYDRFHVVKLAGEAMDEVRSAQRKTESERVKDELGEFDAELFAKTRSHNDQAQASADLKRWISWARAQPTGRIQATGRDLEVVLRCRRARHARPPQQCFLPGHERPDAASQTRCPQI